LANFSSLGGPDVDFSTIRFVGNGMILSSFTI